MALFGFLKKAKASPEDALREVLAGSDVPTFPVLALRVLRVLRDPEATMDEVAEAVQWDLGLMVRVLATVNSAAYGPQREIECVKHAASYLGRNQLEQIVLAVAVRDTLPKEDGPGFEAPRFWRTAALRAALARSIAERLQPARQAECFTAGLLQDLAIPVLAAARPKDYGEVLSAWHGDQSIHLEELETSTFGWNHAQVGGVLSEMWELPDGLSRSIGNHHTDTCTDAELPPATRLVSTLRETQAEFGIEALVEQARSDYGLTADWTRSAVEKATEVANDLARSLA